MTLGETLDDCARKYKGFCQKYQPKSKSSKRFFWGNVLLPKLTQRTKKSQNKNKKNTPQNGTPSAYLPTLLHQYSSMKKKEIFCLEFSAVNDVHVPYTKMT